MLVIEPERGFAERVVARWARVPSPVGDLYVCWTEVGVCSVAAGRFTKSETEFVADVSERIGRPVVPGRIPAEVAEQAATGRASQLRFDLSGLTPFESDVLETTRRIPLGEVRPYAWVAAEIGRPRAVRAVGSALGRNPVPFLIPCHRVTRSDGTIGNYGLGPAMKEELLRVEQVNLDEVLELARKGVHYLGNTTTKVVCFPSCSGIRHVDPAQRRGFGSVSDAFDEGFRPCGRCRPGLARTA